MKIRIRFGKYGELKFVGHLDIMRFFQKCMRRADVDIKYSTGFSPHQIMSFAQPLGLGVTSDGEYMDIEVSSTDTSEKMIERINAACPGSIRIYSYRLLLDKAKTGMAIISAADYEVRFRYPDKVPFDLKTVWPEFIAQSEIMITKETKKGTKDMDIKSLIFENSLMDDGLFLKLSCGSVVNLKPETVMEALYAFAGAELGQFDLLIHRKNLYTDYVKADNEADIDETDIDETDVNQANVNESDTNERASDSSDIEHVRRFMPLEDMGVDILEPMSEEKDETNTPS